MATPGMRIAALILALAVAGCGGGGGGGGSSASDAPATVGVLITDAPTQQWDEAIATITAVRLIGDSGQVTLFSGSQTLDLLKLADFSELFAVSDNVPPGSYSKIRLQVSDLVLNDIDPATGAVLESVRPQLVGNGKIDLNPRSPFTVGPGDTIFVELDFDMEKSLKITETGNGKIIIRPVVFVDIRTDRPDGRLSRIHGEIMAIDAINGDFQLCQTAFASHWDDSNPVGGPIAGDRRCVTVSTDDATGIFGADGLPETFADLAVGEEATVIGRLRPLTDAESNSTGDHLFALDAFVIEEGPLGTYSRIAGRVASTVDVATDRFGLHIAPAQGVISGTTLPVQLFEGSRIFDRSGVELGRADITLDRIALVDGVLVIGDDDFIRSPLVMLGDLAPPGEAVLEGSVVSVDVGEGTLLVNDGTLDRCVDASGAGIFLVDDSDGFSSSRGELGDLVPGQRVSIFGEEGIDGCLIADTILAEL